MNYCEYSCSFLSVHQLFAYTYIGLKYLSADY